MMRYLAILLLLNIICISANAQNSSSLSKTINDDDKTLTLIYKVDSDARHINYENSFDVRGLTKTEKNALVDRIIDSLNNTASNTKRTVTKDSIIKINDNGQKLTVTVDAVSKDRTIHTSRTFDVKGKTKEEKDKMIKKALESADVKDDDEN